MTKPLADENAAGRDRRWRDATERQRQRQKDLLVGSGMDPRKAERQAADMQERTTLMARDQAESK